MLPLRRDASFRGTSVAGAPAAFLRASALLRGTPAPSSCCLNHAVWAILAAPPLARGCGGGLAEARAARGARCWVAASAFAAAFCFDSSAAFAALVASLAACTDDVARHRWATGQLAAWWTQGGGDSLVEFRW